MLDHMRDNCDHISRASSLPSEESRDLNRQIISPKEATGISALRDIAKGLKTVLNSSGFKMAAHEAQCNVPKSSKIWAIAFCNKCGRSFLSAPSM
jgi:hypothetical protein